MVYLAVEACFHQEWLFSSALLGRQLSMGSNVAERHAHIVTMVCLVNPSSDTSCKTREWLLLRRML